MAELREAFSDFSVEKTANLVAEGNTVMVRWMCEAALKSYRHRALAQEARPMTGGKRGRLVQKKQLSPAADPHDGTANAAPLQCADQPRPTCPPAVQQRSGSRIMVDAPISREHSALGFCDDVAHGRDAILKRHGRQGRRASAARRRTATFRVPA